MIRHAASRVLPAVGGRRRDKGEGGLPGVGPGRLCDKKLLEHQSDSTGLRSREQIGQMVTRKICARDSDGIPGNLMRIP